MGASRALNLDELFNGKGRSLIWMGCTAYGGGVPISLGVVQMEGRDMNHGG